MPIELISEDDIVVKDDIRHNDDVKKRFDYVIEYFKKENPNPTTELKYKNRYELLIAVILSAQATDKSVNAATVALFKKYPNPEDLARANVNDVINYIRGIHYAETKSSYLVRTAHILVKEHGGKVPESEEELTRLPGVGRKTAHVILATLFDKPVIAVDTHVMRVSGRIGLTTETKKPLRIEKDLVRYTPKDVVSKMSHWLILHGRYICTAKNPQCSKCGIREMCRYYSDNFG